jgi:hypothetical protein
MNADKKYAICRRLSAFIGGPKHLLCGLATNFGRSSRLADKKAILNFGIQLIGYVLMKRNTSSST